MSGDKILLTGGSGFLGRIVKTYLRSSTSAKIITIGRGSDNDIQFDVSDPSSTIELPDGINTVIHAAGKAHVIPKTDKEAQDFFDVNFLGTKNLCTQLNKLSILPKYFVFISTVAVYGVDEGEMITEDHPLMGNTPYAKSKILAEEYLLTWAKSNNITLTILRLPLVAGPGAPGNLGAMVNSIKKGRYFSIGKANARKSVIWAEDVAKVISLVAPVGGVYNITDGFHPSFKELETIIADGLQVKMPLAIPSFVATLMAGVGDLVGKRSPINLSKLRKIKSTLTFNDSKLHQIVNWTPSPVVEKLKQNL